MKYILLILYISAKYVLYQKKKNRIFIFYNDDIYSYMYRYIYKPAPPLN